MAADMDIEKHASPDPSSASSAVDFAKNAPPIDGLLTIPDPALEQPRSKANSIVPSFNSFDDEPTWPVGWRPWGCLFGCFLLMWNSWGIQNAYGTFQSYYSQHLFPDTPLMLLNLIGSTQSFVVLVFSFVVGRLLDANYARTLIGTGAVLVTLGMMLLSVVNGDGGMGAGSYGLTWLTQGLISGLGQACFFVSSSQVASTWFIKRKAVAIGIVASGASVAGLVYPIMFKFLVTEVGFNHAVRYTGTLVGVTGALSFFLAVPNPRHNFRKPEKWMVTKVWIDTSAFRNPAFCWFSASICFVFFGFYAVFFNLEDWAAHNGFAQKDTPPGLNVSLGDQEVENDAIRTFWLLCIMNISSTAGRLFSACFAEKFGALNIHSIATALGSLLLLLLWTFATTLGPALSFVIVFGAVSGSIIGLPPASIAHILGRTDISAQAKLGQWTGMMYTISSPFSLTGPVIAGYLVTQYGPNNYLTVQIWSGLCLFMAAVCMAASRYYSGPSRTVDAVRKLSATLTLSRTPTVRGDEADSETDVYSGFEKAPQLAGLGRVMPGRQYSGSSTNSFASPDSSRSPVGPLPRVVVAAPTAGGASPGSSISSASTLGPPTAGILERQGTLEQSQSPGSDGNSADVHLTVQERNDTPSKAATPAEAEPAEPMAPLEGRESKVQPRPRTPYPDEE